MMKKALIFYGGWEVHDPARVSARLAAMLEKNGFAVDRVEGTDALEDGEKLLTYDLIVPCMTMSTLPRACEKNISYAVSRGVGLAGCHGGMCDAFRNSTEWQFITGGQWVAHPGNDGVRYTVNVRRGSSPITEGIEDFALTPLFEAIFDSEDSSARILLRIREIQRSKGLPLLGAYSLAGLSLDCDLSCPQYCDTPIPFTKTEAMILRYLVRTYPDGTDVHHILRYAMRPASLSDPSGIRTHIYGINRKFLSKTGRRLIASTPGEGYKILTPEAEPALI